MTINNELYTALHATLMQHTKGGDPALQPLETIAFLYGAVIGVAYPPESMVTVMMHLEYYRSLGYRYGQELQGKADADAMLDKLMKERK